MATILTNIKERILFLAKTKGISYEVFFKELNMSYGNFKGKAKEKSLSSEALAIIVAKYSNVNPEWLLIGKGEMWKNDNIRNQQLIPDKKGIPLIPLDAMAGFGEGDMQVMNYETDKYVVPEFDELNVDFMIRVKGSSMYPKYNSGDLVACKKLPLDTFFQWNKVYVLDTIQGPMIKRIHKSKIEEFILCVSDNTKYDPFDLPISELHSLAIVVGVIRLE